MLLVYSTFAAMQRRTGLSVTADPCFLLWWKP